MEKEKGLLVAVGDAFFQFGTETLPDIAEIGIDSILEDGILKDIPVVNFLLSAGRFFGNVRNAFLAKHVLAFTQQFNSKSLSQEKIKQHYEELEKNPKKKLRELEIVLQSISKHKKYIQDKILANFYAAYCDPDVLDFKWSDFELMSQITEGLFPYDLVDLKKIYDATELKSGEFDTNAIGRLSRLGLVTYDSGFLTWRSTISDEAPARVIINNVGKAFWKYGMKDVKIYSDDGVIL